jgi:hypothetical protein
MRNRAKEPLIKSRAVATAAFRDVMRELALTGIQSID